MMIKTSLTNFKTFLILGLFIMTSAPLEAQGLKIFAKDNGAPKHYITKNNIPAGYAVEIAVAVVERAGFRPVVINIPWKRAVKNALDGHGIITAFSKTRERQEHYLFSHAIYEDRVVLVQNKNNVFPFENYEDLKGKVLGISLGSEYGGEFAKQRESLNLLQDTGNENRLEMLAHGRIDAGIFPGDTFLVKHNIRQLGFDQDHFVIKDRAIAYDGNYLGISKEMIGFDPDRLREKLNRAITLCMEDGTIEKIRNRYNNFPIPE